MGRDDKPETETEYNRTYYERNREKIAARKAARYRNDTEYRQKIIDRNKARKARLRAERAAEGPRPRKRGPYKPRKHLVEVNGEDVEVMMITMGRLAQIFDRKTATLHGWEENGVIPKALYRDRRGVRLFTELQAELLGKAWAKATKKHGKQMMDHRIASTSFPAMAREIWEQYPYGIDTSKTQEKS